MYQARVECKTFTLLAVLNGLLLAPSELLIGQEGTNYTDQCNPNQDLCVCLGLCLCVLCSTVRGRLLIHLKS